MAAITGLKFQDGYCYVKSNGQYPSICINNPGWTIQVNHRETIIGFKLQYTIGYLNGESLIWSEDTKTYNKGFYPRIAMNDNGIVVAVYSSQIGQQIYYNLGRLSYDSHFIPNQETVNSASIDWFVEKEAIGEGHNPDVSINNKNIVVVAYDKMSLRWPWVRTYYRIGDIDIKGKKMVWRSEADSDKRLIESGSCKDASVALNDREQVVVGYSSGIERAVHFLAGTISNSSIIFGDVKFSPPGVNYAPVISVNNHGHVAAVHHTLRGRLSLKINYGLMKLNSDTGLASIEWSLAHSRKFASDGYHASVVITDGRRVVTAYKSLTPNITKSLRNRIGELTA